LSKRADQVRFVEGQTRPAFEPRLPEPFKFCLSCGSLRLSPSNFCSECGSSATFRVLRFDILKSILHFEEFFITSLSFLLENVFRSLSESNIKETLSEFIAQQSMSALTSVNYFLEQMQASHQKFVSYLRAKLASFEERLVLGELFLKFCYGLRFLDGFFASIVSDHSTHLLHFALSEYLLWKDLDAEQVLQQICRLSVHLVRLLELAGAYISHLEMDSHQFEPQVFERELSFWKEAVEGLKETCAEMVTVSPEPLALASWLDKSEESKRDSASEKPKGLMSKFKASVAPPIARVAASRQEQCARCGYPSGVYCSNCGRGCR